MCRSILKQHKGHFVVAVAEINDLLWHLPMYIRNGIADLERFRVGQ